MKIYIFMLLHGCLISGLAISGVSDLELALEFDAPENVVFGQYGEFSITLTNLGPDIAGKSSLDAFPILVKSSIIFSNDNGADIIFGQRPITQECFFLASIGEPLPGELPIYRFDFYYPEIPVNSAITCYGYYVVNFRMGEKEVAWSLNNATDIDPNMNNNSVEMVFGIRPQVVPSLSFWSLLVLISLLFWSGKKYFSVK